MTDDLAAGGLQRGGPGVGGEMVLGREPADVADLTQEVAASTGPTPNSPSRLVLTWATAVLMRASTAAMRCSSWRMSATSSVAS